MSDDRTAKTKPASRGGRDPFKTLSPSAIGFGALPGTPEEARAHVQLRVRTYIGLFAVLWTAMYLGDAAIRFAIAPDFLKNTSLRSVHALHLSECVVLVASWVLLGRRSYSLRVLDVADAIATLSQAAVLAGMLYIGGEPKFRTELVIMLGLTTFLAGRGALVPSTAMRTAVFSAISVLPQPFVTYAVYSTKPVPEGFPDALALGAFAAMWGSLAVLLATAITRIIYGLERKVQQATQLGQYTLESRIGAGGMGMVYLAKHALLRRPTAVKLLPAEKAGKDAIKRFEREVQLTSQLTHPNVVAIYDYGRTPEGVFYYAMEYLEGIDLERLVKEQGPLAPARVKHILRQAADALAEAHDIKLIHRDIKPANIVVLSRGRQHDYVKVLDFGLVKEVRPENNMPSLSNVATLIGTPLYISPESITDPKKVDHRSDVYALGAVGYYLLAGSPPVKGRSLVEVCAWHMYEKPEPLSKRVKTPIPESLEKIILQCLEKDPNKRPQSAAEIVEALDAATDVPPWTAADAAHAWEEVPSDRKTMGPPIPLGESGPNDGDRDSPVPVSRAFPADLQHR